MIPIPNFRENREKTKATIMTSMEVSNFSLTSIKKKKERKLIFKNVLKFSFKIINSLTKIRHRPQLAVGSQHQAGQVHTVQASDHHINNFVTLRQIILLSSERRKTKFENLKKKKKLFKLTHVKLIRLNLVTVSGIRPFVIFLIDGKNKGWQPHGKNQN